MPKIISFPDIPDKEFEVGDDFTPTDVEELYNIHRPVQSAGRQALGRFAQGLAGSLAGIPESAAIIANKIGDEFPSIDEGKPLTELDTYKLGKRIRETAEQLAPIDPKRKESFWIDTLPQAAGSMVGFLGAGGVTKKALTLGGTKLTGESAADAIAGKMAADAIAGRVAVAGVGAASGMAEGYEDAIRKGASPETAWQSGLINAGLGTTEAASLGRWIDGVNKASGGRLLSAVKEGTVEGAQEVLQQFGGNVTAKDILGYDPERGRMSGVLEGGAAGGILGSIAGLLIGGRRAGGTTTQGVPEPTTTPTPAQPDKPFYNKGLPILPATEIDRIAKDAENALSDEGIKEALSEIPAEEVLQTEPEVAPVATEVAAQEPEIAPVTPEVAAPIQEVAPETPAFVPPEPNLLPLTTQVLQEQLTAVQKPATLANGKTQPDQLQAGTQEDIGINREAATDDASAIEGRNTQAANAWIEAVSSDDIEAIRYLENELLGSEEGRKKLKELEVLVGRNIDWAKVRASGDYGGSIRQAAIEERTRSSQERKQLGQQPGKPSVSEPIGTLNDTWEAALSGRNENIDKTTARGVEQAIQQLSVVQDNQEQARWQRRLQGLLAKEFSEEASKEINKQLTRLPNALRKSFATESLLGQARPELGLPQVVQGNTQQEVAAKEGQKEEVTPVEAAATIQQEVTATAKAEGKRPAKAVKDELVSRLEQAIKSSPTVNDLRSVYPNREPDNVTFEIPGDGTFTVVNTKENLEGLLKRAKRIKTSSGEPAKVKYAGTGPTKADQLIAFLESKLKSPSDTTQAVLIPGLDPATARAVWNTALRIAIGVLKATKNVQMAIQAGIDSIKKALADRKLALDATTEAALRNELESGLTDTGPVRERAKTGTSQSALYQGGEYVLRNEKEDTKLANEFVDQRNGDLEQAFRDSKQISEIAFRKVVQAEILARASVQWSKAGKFDPGLVRLMGSIGAEIKAMKSGAGQDLQAEKQVNQKLYPHMPVLSWLDILRQRQAKDIAPDLKGKEPAIIGAADKAGKVAKEAKEGKGKVFIEVLDEDMRQQGVPPEVRKKVLKAAARIIRAKPKTPEELFDAMAQEWNLEAMDGPTSQRLKELSQEAQATPAGSRRNKVLQRMVDTLYDAKGVSASEFVRDFFYANVLSSLRTFADVLLGSSINGFTIAVRGALDTAIAGKNYTKAIQIIGQYFGGIAEGASNAIDIIKTGDYSRLPDSEARLMAMLDDPLTMRAGALEALKRAPQTWKKVLGQTAYVSRIMTGLDFVGGLGARDSMLVYSVMTRKDIDSLEALEKRFQKETNQQAEQQAIAELGPKAKRIDVLARKRELLEEGISKDIRDNASELGRLAALNAQPVGWLQPLVDAVARMPFLPKTLAGFNFLRSSVNMVQQSSDFLPGVGLVSFGRARMTESEWFKTLPKNHPMRLFGLSVSPERRRLIAHAQIGGFAITALMAAKVLYDDDEDKTLDISAGWKGVTPNQRKQLMDSGERPYHIKIGNRWFSYKQTPFAAALAFVGTARDQKRFNKEKWDEQQFGEKLINAFIGGSLYLKDISALSSFANLVGISASNTEDIDYQDVNRTIAQSVMNAGGGMVPLASLQRDIDSWLDPKIYKANSGVDYWLRNIPFVRRTIGEGPVINALGEPAIVGREPWSRWTIAENERPLYDMLRKKFHEGVFLPVAGATAQTIDKQTGQRRRMTPIETYEYQKKSGQLMKQQLEKNLKTLDRMTAPEFQKWVEQTQRQISVEARR